jgi:hypothetical protein
MRLFVGLCFFGGSELSGGKANELAKDAGKMIRVLESHLVRDFFYAHIGILQQLAGPLNF